MCSDSYIYPALLLFYLEIFWGLHKKFKRKRYVARKLSNWVTCSAFLFSSKMSCSFCKRFKLVFYTLPFWKWIWYTFKWTAYLIFYCIFLVLNKTIFSKQCCCSITEVLIPGNTSMSLRFSCKLSGRMVSNLITVLATVKVCSVFFVHVFAVFGMQ